jgi:hypothetical protein
MATNSTHIHFSTMHCPADFGHSPAPFFPVLHDQNGLRADRFRWSRQLDEVGAILAADSDRQNRAWESSRIGAIGSSSGGSGKQPASFEEYLDSLQFQKWYIGQALVIMDVAAIDGKIAHARESSSFRRVSQSACSIM